MLRPHVITNSRSLLLAYQVRDRPVLVVGGGDVAAGRIQKLLVADANVTVICPSSGLHEQVSAYIQQGAVKHVDREYVEDDVDGSEWAMVMTAIDDPEASRAIYRQCKAARIPVNVADVPAECDFYFGSELRNGPLQVLVSTNGNGPRMANIVRRRIEAALPQNCGAAIRNVGALRMKLRELYPAADLGPQRMKW